MKSGVSDSFTVFLTEAAVEGTKPPEANID
jgi:hypothetical protein